MLSLTLRNTWSSSFQMWLNVFWYHSRYSRKMCFASGVRKLTCFTPLYLPFPWPLIMLPGSIMQGISCFCQSSSKWFQRHSDMVSRAIAVHVEAMTRERSLGV